MKIYIKLLTIFITLLLIVSCTNNTKDEDLNVTGINHYNITFAPDLSNRTNMNIHPKPLQDQNIIEASLSLIDAVLRYGYRDTDQKDSYSMTFINQGLIHMYDIKPEKLFIDFGSFKRQLDRINYIKCRGNSSHCLADSKADFMGECNQIYSKAIENTSGADIWSFFEYRIDEHIVKNPEDTIIYSGHMYQNRYKNILILFTDGYIECGLTACAASGHSKNQSYDLGQSRIRDFRKAFKASGVKDIQEFYNKESYGIVPLSNKLLENLHVLVIELYDRSLSVSGNATVHPTDAEIMKLFWSDWLTKSNVKSFELHTCFDNKREARETIEQFISSRN